MRVSSTCLYSVDTLNSVDALRDRLVKYPTPPFSLCCRTSTKIFKCHFLEVKGKAVGGVAAFKICL